MLPENWSAMDDVRLVGAAVRAARKAARLTQKDLADLAGISERTVRAIETGLGNPSIGAVVAATSTLGLKLRVE